MAEYLMLRARKAKLLEVLDERLRIADEHREVETSSAIKIQRVFRGSVLRTDVAKKNYSAREIERVFRGHMGRQATRALVREKQSTRNLYYLHYLCIQLQRCFRGYYSRKYKHDQARRKQYCRMVEEQGRKAVEQMAMYAQTQADREAEEMVRKREQEFVQLAQNLHHLTSTAHIRGVYNPLIDCVEMPTMNRLPVEQHIRGVVKDLLRTRGITKRGLVADINGTMKIPYNGQKYRLSVQASAPYDTVQKEKQREQLLHKILTRGKQGDFVAGGKTKLLEKTTPVPLSTNEVYLDPWANPMLVKGVPSSQKELLQSARSQKALFVKHIEKPFVSSVGGNRSSTLPNNVFDVIAEAQETGGAIQRHLGTGTSRFGLSGSMDARSGTERPPDATIPAPPIRTSSTLKTTQTRLRTFTLVDRSRPPHTRHASELSMVEERSLETSTLSGGGYGSSSDDEV